MNARDRIAQRTQSHVLRRLALMEMDKGDVAMIENAIPCPPKAHTPISIAKIEEKPLIKGSDPVYR